MMHLSKHVRDEVPVGGMPLMTDARERECIKYCLIFQSRLGRLLYE